MREPGRLSLPAWADHLPGQPVAFTRTDIGQADGDVDGDRWHQTAIEERDDLAQVWNDSDGALAAAIERSGDEHPSVTTAIHAPDKFHWHLALTRIVPRLPKQGPVPDLSRGVRGRVTNLVP